MDRPRLYSTLLTAALSLPASAAFAYDSVMGAPAGWQDPMLVGGVYRNGLLVQDQLKAAR